MTSIWLRPEPSQEQALQSLIRSVAAEQGTVPFAPHLTVCGAPGDPATLDAAAAYVKECGLVPLPVAKTAVPGAVITPFRAVFIEVENTPQLHKFRERLRDILGAPPLIPPHISLLYTLDGATQAPRPDLDAGRLAAIAARCAAAIPDTHFLLGRPIAHSSGGSGMPICAAGKSCVNSKARPTSSNSPCKRRVATLWSFRAPGRARPFAPMFCTAERVRF